MISYKLTYLMGRVLKKTGLNNKVNHHLFRSQSAEIKENEFAECIERLHALSPDVGKSAIRTTPTSIQEEYDLQIIIPAYNEERHIARCVNSILRNECTYKVLTVIVNDGSTDNTANILQPYSAIPNIEIIHQENKGFSGARNRGLDNLRAKYVMFVDGDDSLPKGSIQKLLDKAYLCQADIIGGGYFIVNQSYNIVSKYIPTSDRQHGYPCGKLYRSHLFRNLQFPENYWFEDTVIGMMIDTSAIQTENIYEPVYYYLDNPEGITHKSSGNVKVLDSLYVTQQLLKDRESVGMRMTSRFYDVLLYQIRLNQYRINSLQNNNINKDVFFVTRYMISRFPDFKTQDIQLKLLEWSLRNNNFLAYMLSCS